MRKRASANGRLSSDDDRDAEKAAKSNDHPPLRRARRRTTKMTECHFGAMGFPRGSQDAPMDKKVDRIPPE